MIERKLQRREAGMSLVELMVAMLIGLIGIVIITHLYVTNDQYKRSTTGAGTAHINGVVALYSLEREIRMAGYGINHALALGCKCKPVTPLCSPVQYWYNGNSSYPPAPAALGALPARAAVPVLITDTPGGPDAITALYSSTNERMMPGALSEDTLVPNHDYRVDYVQGFEKGNLILVAAEDGTCLLKQITKVESGMLQHRDPPYNPLGSYGPGMPKKSAVFNLGTPGVAGGTVWRTFFVQDNRLQSEDLLRTLQAGAPVTQQLVDDIVDLQAEYGKDDGSALGSVAEDGVVDAWGTTLPLDPDDLSVVLWHRIVAVRVGVLARSQNYEKPSVAGGPCEATQAAPTWAGGAFTVPDGLPSCYKYRVFQTVIPLRNMIWRQE